MEIAAIFLNSKLAQFNFLPWLTCTAIPPDGKKWEKNLVLCFLWQNSDRTQTQSGHWQRHLLHIAAECVQAWCSFPSISDLHVIFSNFAQMVCLWISRLFKNYSPKRNAAWKQTRNKNIFASILFPHGIFLLSLSRLKDQKRFVLVDWNFLDFAVSSKKPLQLKE